MKIEIVVANQIEKSRDFDKNMILSDVPCGHFSLYAVFDVNDGQSKLTELAKSKKCQTWHENQTSCHKQILICLN